jgi:MipA family protein
LTDKMFNKKIWVGMNIQRSIIVLLLGLCILLPQNAISEEKPLWELGIGAGILQMPDYRGSDENRLYFLPYPYVIYRGGILKIDEQRISGQIFKTDRILLDFSGYGAVPVKSSNNSARVGMPDLDPTFEVGPALRIRLLESKTDRYKLSLALPLRAFFSTDFSSVRREGWVFSPRINLEKDDVIAQTGLNLGISAGPMFTDSSYNAYFYTVDPAFATRGRPAYSAGGGYSGSTLTVGLTKAYKQFVFNAFVSADFLHGAVFEDSPLVKTRTSVMSGFGISWIFFKSAKTVESDK